MRKRAGGGPFELRWWHLCLGWNCLMGPVPRIYCPGRSLPILGAIRATRGVQFAGGRGRPVEAGGGSFSTVQAHRGPVAAPVVSNHGGPLARCGPQLAADQCTAVPQPAGASRTRFLALAAQFYNGGARAPQEMIFQAPPRPRRLAPWGRANANSARALGYSALLFCCRGGAILPRRSAGAGWFCSGPAAPPRRGQSYSAPAPPAGSVNSSAILLDSARLCARPASVLSGAKAG